MAMQLRVDVSADGRVLATLADNELQVMRSSELQKDSLDVFLPCLFELILHIVYMGPNSAMEISLLEERRSYGRHRALQ